MNATILYTQLSRQVLMLKADAPEESLNVFLDPEKGFFKLKTYLSCRSCRKLGTDPYGAEYCNHLLCKSCFNENKYSNGCKWCRSEDSLVMDYKHNILLGLYKNLCAILLDYVTGWDGGTGISNTKQKLIQFLNDGSLPEKISCDSKLTHEKTEYTFNQSNNKFAYGNNSSEKLDKALVFKKDANIQIDIPSTCYTCKCQTTRKKTFVDFSHDPRPISLQEGDLDNLNEKVASTPHHVKPSEKHEITDPDVLCNESKNLLNGKEDFYASKGKNFKTDSDPLIRSKKKLYKSISSTILSKRNNMNIFEKFGLALTPPQKPADYIGSLKKSHHKNHLKKVYKEQNDLQKIGCKEPKIEPLKLKMKRVNATDSDDSNYSVQYNITNGIDKKGYSSFHLEDDESERYNAESCRKNKRRASTFITNYAIFSDDSDFEQLQEYQKRKKPWTPKEVRDVCGCGVGTNIKYLNDICKRSRCPCYSQGRACLNCKCRFCSNPFVLENDKVSLDHGSSSSECQAINKRNLQDSFIQQWAKEEPDLVDVEAL